MVSGGTLARTQPTQAESLARGSATEETMFGKTVFAFLLLALTGAPAAQVPGRPFVAFGPATYVRAEGQPVTVTRTFTVRNPSAAYTLRIDNGGLGGEFARVAAATVSLNGAQVVRPGELNPTVAVLE